MTDVHGFSPWFLSKGVIDLVRSRSTRFSSDSPAGAPKPYITPKPLNPWRFRLRVLGFGFRGLS